MKNVCAFVQNRGGGGGGGGGSPRGERNKDEQGVGLGNAQI